jgi:hypothetical protein
VTWSTRQSPDDLFHEQRGCPVVWIYSRLVSSDCFADREMKGGAVFQFPDRGLGLVATTCGERMSCVASPA